MFKKIKQILEFHEGMIKDLQEKNKELENKLNELWEESHPRVMGGKK